MQVDGKEVRKEGRGKGRGRKRRSVGRVRVMAAKRRGEGMDTIVHKINQTAI